MYTIMLTWRQRYFARFLGISPVFAVCTFQLGNNTVAERYSHCVFRSASHMLSIGYGMEPPYNLAEMWLVIISMMLGASFYALFIAYLSGLVVSWDASGRQYEEKVSAELSTWIDSKLFSLQEPGVTAWEKYTFCVLRAVAHIFSIDYGMEEVPKTYADMFTILISMAAGVTMFMIIVAHMSGLVMGAVDGSSAIAYAKKVSICLH